MVIGFSGDASRRVSLFFAVVHAVKFARAKAPTISDANSPA
jgi:hypothetical protein